MNLPENVIIEACTPELIDSVASTPDVSKMEVTRGKAIVEHKHGNSMYFSKNVAFLTLHKNKYKLPANSWVFIPEGVMHGWEDIQKNETGEVYSYHQDHKEYTLASL